MSRNLAVKTHATVLGEHGRLQVGCHVFQEVGLETGMKFFCHQIAGTFVRLHDCLNRAYANASHANCVLLPVLLLFSTFLV